jgi:hypothetical protein
MKRVVQAAVLCVFGLWPVPALAHPAPFTFLDVHLSAQSADLTLVAHVFDVAHDLDIDPPDRLLDAAFLAARRDIVIALLTPRLRLTPGGDAAVSPTWSEVTPPPQRQSIQLRGRLPMNGVPATLAIDALMFPYDPVHQTFVNVYEGDRLMLQAILDQTKTRLDYFSGTPRGTTAVLRRFTLDGFRHMLLKPEHLLFLAGLLLLGGSLSRLAIIVSAFTAGQLAAVVVALAAGLSPPARILEPAIALSLVYLGADNLMVRGGRDVRVWIALGAGAIHGLWFATELRGFDLSSEASRWSLVAFNAGIEMAQLLGAATAGVVLGRLWTRQQTLGRRVASIGSVVVIAAGAIWFVQRVFFPGGAV